MGWIMKKRTLQIMLAVLLLAGLCARHIPAAAVNQAEIDALEVERDGLRDRQDSIQEQIGALRTDMDAILTRKAALDERSELLRQDIALLEEQIALYDQIIAEKRADAEQAGAEEAEQFARYRRRVRALEEGGSRPYIAFLLNAASLSDLLSRLNDVTDILSRDQNLRAEYVAARERAEAAAAAYEAAQEAQRSKRAELLGQEALLAAQLEDAGRLIAQLEADIDRYTEFYEAVEEEKARVEALIDEKAEALRRQQEEEERRKNQPSAATGAPTSGYYVWPSYTAYITSPFGPRTHPIYGVLKPHTGVDIGAAYGTAVTAAAAGTVSAAVPDYGSAGYGTYAAIYHSNGTTTLYGHMSSLAVSAGDTVAQGQTIGYVGSTGASTGPHLHFEIRVDGACVDPMQYF